MIYKLQRRFILICTASVLSVVLLIFTVFCVWNVSSMNRNMDILADSVSEGGGRFPKPFDDMHRHDRKPPMNDRRFDFITPETPFSTRYFTVFFDDSGEVDEVITDSIYSISDEQAIGYAQKVIDSDGRGWVSTYRYKVFSTGSGKGVVFIDGSMSRSSLMQSVTIVGVILILCAILVLILIFLLSKKAVKPIAESYEKQKQFVTDASHELKTPLTLILTNVDIAESELGKNEWLDDIRSEGNRLAGLVNQLVEFSRMDEEEQKLSISSVPFGQIVADTVSEFSVLARDHFTLMIDDIDTNVVCKGDEMMLKKLVGILLDNAFKYCDTDGEISVRLYSHSSVVLTVENTYANADKLELDRLFDRFYRDDKSRTFSGGYGIGLSIAKTIVKKHHGEISAYTKGNCCVGFKVVLNK